MDTKKHVFIIILILSIFFLSGCAARIVRSEYTPKTSIRSLTIKKNLASIAKEPKIFVLKFQDKRMHYKEKNIDVLKSKGWDDEQVSYEDLKDPYLIFKYRENNDHRFKTKTLCDYLHESLIFDLSSLGFNIVSDKKSDLSFQEIIKNNKIVPTNISYVIGIDVLMCEPRVVAGWGQPDELFYHYYYHLKIYDVLKSKVLYDAELNRTIEGTQEVEVLFTTMVDKLLNDYLFEINYDVAEILVKYK